MIHIFLLFNRQGKIRLQKWYDVYTAKDQRSIIRELTTTVMKRTSNMSNILEWRNLQVVYKRYASLYILLATSKTDNELLTLELIHRYVEALDLYFGNVCELDIVFNFNKLRLKLAGFTQPFNNFRVGPNLQSGFFFHFYIINSKDYLFSGLLICMTVKMFHDRFTHNDKHGMIPYSLKNYQRTPSM